MNNKLIAASIQIESIPMDIDKNLEKAVSLINKIPRDIDLVVLPELFNTGYEIDSIKETSLDKLIEYYDKTTEFISTQSKKNNLYIAAGIFEIYDEQLYNSLIVFNNNGKIICSYKKISLFDPAGENAVFKQGNKLKTFSLNGFTIGLMICYDLRFPEISRAYIDLDADVLLISAAFPYARIDHWQALLKARAVENQSYIIASNSTGKNDKYCFGGSSCIIDPAGIICKSLNEKEESVILHELNLDFIHETRKNLPCLADRKKIKGIII